jgi:hypothetical protein
VCKTDLSDNPTDKSNRFIQQKATPNIINGNKTPDFTCSSLSRHINNLLGMLFFNEAPENSIF